ncbi:hypothetical protein S7711_10616 [Stachybotrys chartarum IBT 7711]|uniref:Uncharacterized protein n=1 Tax=Stachybotrys chartarum (strain CBS 109288 / IBT 7711) TaxID=1280523 RepID=A0A084AZ25_STACB|nr:hypothetical protein S7711_10616 [Stachybotrys chartarum IBT 7711]KFA73208.1 hypothetical protein S40288_11327 [Stachybotrys chartarum IBT 40288]
MLPQSINAAECADQRCRAFTVPYPHSDQSRRPRFLLPLPAAALTSHGITNQAIPALLQMSREASTQATGAVRFVAEPPTAERKWPPRPPRRLRWLSMAVPGFMKSILFHDTPALHRLGGSRKNPLDQVIQLTLYTCNTTNDIGPPTCNSDSSSPTPARICFRSQDRPCRRSPMTYLATQKTTPARKGPASAIQSRRQTALSRDARRKAT